LYDETLDPDISIFVGPHILAVSGGFKGEQAEGARGLFPQQG
jgi:hypothetical protein